MNKSAVWLWEKELNHEKTQLMYFRKEINLETKPLSAFIKISADSRYKIYVNQQLVEVGPSKGDPQCWYFDQMDISPYLMIGANVIGVEVLHYSTKHDIGNFGIFRTNTPGLYIDGEILTENQAISLNTNNSWKVALNKQYSVYAEDDVFSPLYIFEKTAGNELTAGWLYSTFSDVAWEDAYEYQNDQISSSLRPENLKQRKIPFLYRDNKRMKDITNLQSNSSRKSWENMIKYPQKHITIPAYKKEIIELSAGYEETSYLYLLLRQGAGAKIKILYAESYVSDETEMSNGMEIPIKGQRDDYQNGHLNGFYDYYKVLGTGTEAKRESYTPFWFRTFRYLRLEIETFSEELILDDIWHEETGYPLDVQTEVTTSDSSLNDIWEISERTLRRCMHETYEDCPFYEQLQYIMDTRSQILYTYSIANDDRLARQCIDQFSHSINPNGMLNGAYPSYEKNIIPGFSIYYLLMLTDHWQYYKDINLITEYFPIAEQILNYFSNQVNEKGYLNKIGGLNGKSDYWSFIDWAPQWSETSGVPTAIEEGPLTMESLLYLLGLQQGIKLAKIMNDSKKVVEYTTKEAALKQAIISNCMGVNGLLQDGPGVEEYSQHAQVFGIITGVLTGKQAKRNLLETLNNPEDYAQCSVAMSLYLFRALEITGLYDWTNHYWDIWRRMIAKKLTTSVESESGERSDCHAWGALILHELPSVTLGVRPLIAGYSKVEIAPVTGYLKWAKGKVITPVGMIEVAWYKNSDGIINLDYMAPEGVEVVVNMERERIKTL
ncbi:alpha-L-rhamnosidase-related protein [Dellaglioa sp. BT-FLS60]